MKENEFDVAYRILDDDLLDCDGRRCGKVDDVELQGEPGGPATITHILVGAGAMIPRLSWPFDRLAARILHGGMVRIPWDEVDDIGATVNLKRTADELGLGQGDNRAAPLVNWIPGSR
jgi:sporulation protein YlmC with PRC-barrel domain